MFLWKLFWTNPVMAMAVLFCLATIFACLLILRKRNKGPERHLAALIGIVAIYQGLRLLKEAGVVTMPGSHAFDAFADLTVAGMYLISVVVLRISLTERKSTQVRLRLVEAEDHATRVTATLCPSCRMTHQIG